MMFQNLFVKSGNFTVPVVKVTDFELLYLDTQTPNLVLFVMFETFFGTLIVLQISKASSLSVNYAEFPKMTAKPRLVQTYPIRTESLN